MKFLVTQQLLMRWDSYSLLLGLSFPSPAVSKVRTIPTLVVKKRANNRYRQFLFKNPLTSTSLKATFLTLPMGNKLLALLILFIKSPSIGPGDTDSESRPVPAITP